MMIRSFLILWLMLSCAIAHAIEHRKPAEALVKAQEYLWSQQKEDGSWRSEQYAVMRSGQSLTPFVLHTLLNDSGDHPEKLGAAVEFIIGQRDAQGVIGKSDPDIFEYPVYSTAYAVVVLGQLRGRKGGSDLDMMRSYLISAQFTTQNGFTPEMPAYGGWGFDKPKSPGDPGHMDLSHTRRAIEAIKLINFVHFPEDETSFEKQIASPAQRFLAVVQKRPETLAIQPVPDGVERPESIPFDGGFYFSPVVLQANKGRLEKDGNYWRSYATATCDGILALLAAGVPKDDERVTAAAKWLREHTNLDYPQGIPTDYPEPWGAALQYYHFAVRAEVYAALDFADEEKQALAEKVAALQRADGSFVNTKSPLMKEDEPLLTTALAVVALSHCTP